MSRKRVRGGTLQRLPRRQARHDKRLLLRRRARMEHREASHDERHCQSKHYNNVSNLKQCFFPFCERASTPGTKCNNSDERTQHTSRRLLNPCQKAEAKAHPSRQIQEIQRDKQLAPTSSRAHIRRTRHVPDGAQPYMTSMKKGCVYNMIMRVNARVQVSIFNKPNVKRRCVNKWCEWEWAARPAQIPRSQIWDNDLQFVGSNHIVRFECVIHQGNQSIV